MPLAGRRSSKALTLLRFDFVVKGDMMHIDINRICVPTDFSLSAEKAIHYGVALAEKHDAELHLLHVLQDFEQAVLHPDFTASGEQARAYFNRLEDAAGTTAEDKSKKQNPTEDEAVHSFLRSLEKGTENQFSELPLDKWWERIQILKAIRYGNPAKEICRYARKQNVDLLVLGTHGRTGLNHLLIGSVAERIVRTAPCPVLTVRDHEHNFVLEE